MKNNISILKNIIAVIALLSICGVVNEDAARADWLHPDYSDPSTGASTISPEAAPNGISHGVQAGDLVTSGFLPEVNGFSFPNYGGEHGDGLRPEEMKRLFGADVCSSTAGGECILSPPAKRWMEEINKAMTGGHCEGMAVLSALMYYGKISPEEFGADEAYKLSIENQPLQHEIAYWFATQYTHPGGDKAVKESPDLVLKTLIESLREGKSASELWELGVYQRDMSGGHAVTPFGVQDTGDGKYKIMVYDNEDPGKTQEIDVDQNANTWSYGGGSYTGDASSQNLEITAISPRLGQQKGDFSDDSQKNSLQSGEEEGRSGLSEVQENTSNLSNVEDTLPASKYLQVWIDGNASLLITDNLGRRVGRIEANKYVNEIPGAEIKPLRAAATNISEKRREPMYRVPSGKNFTIKVDGTWLKKADEEDVTVIGPGYDLAVEGVWLDPGEQDYIDIATVGRDYYQLTYRTNYTESPDIIIGKDTDQADYEFTIRGAKIEPEGRFNVGLDMLSGRLMLNPIGNSEADMFELLVHRIDDNGEQFLRADNLTLKSNSTAYLNFTEIKSGDKNLHLDLH